MVRSEGEPTEEPTLQRLLKARQRGEVAVSRDLSAAVALAALVAVLAGTAPLGVGRVLVLFRQVLGTAPGHGVVTTQTGDATAWGAAALHLVASVLALPLGVALGVGVLMGMMQTGGLLAWQAARPTLTRLSPGAGLKRVMGPRVLAESAKGLIKVTVVLAAALTSVIGDAPSLRALTGSRPAGVLTALGAFALRLGVRVVLALVALGILDWLLSRHRHRRSLMMTRDEVKREYKESEGDPRHRAERQRLHRELGEQRMIDEVRKADFVVVNPEHIAVAVKYDRLTDSAPQVVAKGERLFAERIKQVAREAGVPIYRDVGLARALNGLPEGEEIPEILYEAVAELLRVLWEIEQEPARPAHPRTAGEGAPPASSAVGRSPSARSSPSTWKRV